MQNFNFRTNFRFFVFFILLNLIPAGFAFGVSSVGNITVPEPPRVYLDTTFPAQAGNILTVNTANCNDVTTGLQAQINTARYGDTIVIPAGSICTGNYVLKYKDSSFGSGWIMIESSTLSSLPADNRVSPNQSNLMPKIVTPNSAAVFVTESRAHNYRLAGLEITSSFNDQVNKQYGLVTFGNAETSYAELPTDFTLDRCYVHGFPDSNNKRGVAMNAARIAIIDSYFSDFYSRGQDAQAIGSWNGPGPFKIVNNYLEAATENILFGGASATIPGLIASDIEIRHNYMFKPLSWKADDPSYAGIDWSIKNLFELKNAQRVIVDGNMFENNWVDTQTGWAILFNGIDGAASTIQNIQFTNNIIKNSTNGMSISANSSNYIQFVPTGNILVQNNLFEGIANNAWNVLDGAGSSVDISNNGPNNVTIDHNTTLSAYGDTMHMGDHLGSSSGFVFQNNLANYGTYGVIGSGKGSGTACLDAYTNGGYTFTDNVLWGSHYEGFKSSTYPAGTFFPVAATDIGFVNYHNGIDGDYHLLSTSPYKNAGTDGKDIGADIDSILVATNGVITGIGNTVISITTSPISLVPAVTCLITNTLRINSRSEQVKCLQTILGGLTRDGIFGPQTKQAVIKFQLAHQLQGDGVVGVLTRRVLNK